jgi:GH15 family glucan-1,4-alpha-glucosidase
MMPGRIEDYAMVGDLQTAALVGSDGSVDWLCFPRFDSPACFAALLGEDANGRWRLAPTSGGRCTRRRYRERTLVLETEWETPEGAVRVVDCMPPRGVAPDLVRVIEGLRGKVSVTSELGIRFDYGHVAPWITIEGREVCAVAGPDALWLRASAPHEEREGEILSRFTVSEGERIPFVLTWSPSYGGRPVAIDGLQAVDDTERFWLDWAGGISYEGRWQDAVYRSLLTLKGLTYEPSGGIVAAATTSLPETLGGSRNWDYRYCWLRDSTFTLGALLGAGLLEEARSWQQWVLRAVAGDPADVQIMYGIDGTRRLPEYELPWLPGYEGASPVRIGNDAAGQVQGELLALRNDVGLLSEEYDTRAQRLVGNFPQAFTHLALVNCALRLSEREVSSAARE